MHTLPPECDAALAAGVSGGVYLSTGNASAGATGTVALTTGNATAGAGGDSSSALRPPRQGQPHH